MKEKLYLTVGNHPQKPGKLIAIVTDGHFRRGDKQTKVLTLEVVKTQAEAKDWFERVKVTRPWETRN